MSFDVRAKMQPRASEQQAAPIDRQTARLRVGVMLDGWANRAWMAKIVEDIQQSDAARVVTVIMNRAETASRWHGLGSLLRVFLFHAYYRLDRWLARRVFKIERDAFDRIDLRPLVGNAEVLEVFPVRGKFTDQFDAATVQSIRDQQLDVILRIGFRIIRGPILESARYGVWSFHHGDNREYRGTPPMFWEMYEGNPVCGVTLQILTDELDGGKVIFRSSEKTNFFSLYLNYHRNYWKGTQGVLLRLRQLGVRGWEAIDTLDTYREQVSYGKPIYRLPGNLLMVRFMARLAVRVVQRALANLSTEEQWSVGWRRRPTPEVAVPSTDVVRFQMLRPPRGFSYADPFPIAFQGRHAIFFEDFDSTTRHGVISCVELDAQGTVSEPRVALTMDCHLSYPFVFEQDGQAYMIPETRAHRRIELWRAERFPDRWSFDRVLIDGIGAVDATWLHYQDRFWLFAGVALEGSLSTDQLHIFSSTAPFGPWRAHRGNPVVTTVRGARPAGRLFVHDGRLIRPGQDGAKVYGHQVCFHQVEQLSDADYRETRIGVFGPDWWPANVGTHTYNFDSQYEVIDGRVRVARRPWLRKRRPYAS